MKKFITLHNFLENIKQSSLQYTILYRPLHNKDILPSDFSLRLHDEHGDQSPHRVVK